MLTATLGVVLPVLAAPPAAAGNAACGFGASRSPDAAIPDQGSITETNDLTVLDIDDPIVDLDVVIDVNHTFVEDIVVTLSSRGEKVLLTSRNGFSGDNYASTRFDDGASTKISDGSPPFTGSFRPEQSLNAFDDLALSGLWTLTVTDAALNDTGTLVSWRIVFHTKWCDDADRDTVKGEYDLCPDRKGVQPHGCPVRARTLTIAYNRRRGRVPWRPALHGDLALRQQPAGADLQAPDREGCADREGLHQRDGQLRRAEGQREREVLRRRSSGGRGGRRRVSARPVIDRDPLTWRQAPAR